MVRLIVSHGNASGPQLMAVSQSSGSMVEVSEYRRKTRATEQRMYRHYTELAALKARLEEFTLRLDAHVRAFAERDRISNLRNGPPMLDRRYALSSSPEDAKTLAGLQATSSGQVTPRPAYRWTMSIVAAVWTKLETRKYGGRK